MNPHSRKGGFMRTPFCGLRGSLREGGSCEWGVYTNTAYFPPLPTSYMHFWDTKWDIELFFDPPVNANHKLKIVNNPLPKHDIKMDESSDNYVHHTVSPPPSWVLDFLVAHTGTSPLIISFFEHDYHATFYSNHLHISASIGEVPINNNMVDPSWPISASSMPLLDSINYLRFYISYPMKNSYGVVELCVMVGPITMLVPFFFG